MFTVSVEKLRVSHGHNRLDPAYLGSKLANEVGTVQMDKGITDLFRHALDSRRMCPVRVMNGSERDGTTLYISMALVSEPQKPTLHCMAVKSICVASKEWMKLGGKAVACFCGETSDGALGSVM